MRKEPPGENRTLLSRARGSRGEGVQLVQQALRSWGCQALAVELLPRFGADSSFGGETEHAVQTFQEIDGALADGIVGPTTLAHLDDFVLGDEPTISRQPPVPSPGTPAVTGKTAQPVSADAAVSDRITSLSLKPKSKPTILRETDSNDPNHLSVTLENPLEFTGAVTFKPGPALGNMELGFFQLGRPFEVYRATYRRKDGAAVSKPDQNVDETAKIRKDLPAQDHADVFYRSLTNGAKTIVVGAGAQAETVKYDDHPASPFQKEIVSNSVKYKISGIAAQSFFFLGFGILRKGAPLMLATRYWTMKHCEALAPSDDFKKPSKGNAVEITLERSCQKTNCDLGEPGAGAAAGSAPGWGNTVGPDKTYSRFVRLAILNRTIQGPGKFTIGC
jgi:peptidoglycan hydrolase-like protein with peptidoglycan-binding domain